MMKTKNKSPRQGAPSGDALAKYRTFEVPSIAKQIQCMNGFLAHRLAFALMGDDGLANAAGRAWVEDALILSTMPAGNSAEAHEKVDYLSKHLEDWARDAASKNHHAAAIRALDAVITVERARWGLDTGGEHASVLH